MSIDTPPAQKNKKNRKKRPPKKITETYLHNAGLYYLQRFSASSGHFRTVMLRKVRRSCLYHTDQDFENCAVMVDRLVDKFLQSGLLDDDTYIRGMVASLRRKGLSEKMILQKMRLKCVEPAMTKRYLAEYDQIAEDQDVSAELKAAMTFARKKKIGPFALHEPVDLKKTLGKFARAGFSYEISNKVLKMHTEEMEELLH